MDRVRSILESLQMRVPKASYVLVCTHMDLCEKRTLDDLIGKVHRVAEEVEKKGQMNQTSIRNMFGDSVSFAVNSLKGTGVEKFREALYQAAMSCKWYNEMLPESFIRLREHIQKVRQAGVVRMPWKEYAAMATGCGLKEELFRLATAFFHDTFVIQFFGDVEMAITGNTDPSNVLSETVYTSPRWMFDCFKGVVRHEHHSFFAYLNGESWEGEEVDRRALLRCICILKIKGVLTVCPAAQLDCMVFSHEGVAPRPDIAKAMRGYKRASTLHASAGMRAPVSRCPEPWSVCALLTALHRPFSALDCPV